jgi:hypothetical protein
MEEKEKTALSNTADAITEKLLRLKWTFCTLLAAKAIESRPKNICLKPACIGTLVNISKDAFR